MHWLYLHFPRLQLDLFEQLHPEQTGPTVVIDGTDNTVCQLSAAALTAGIKPGMGLAEITAIHAQTCIIEYAANSENCQLEQLATTLYAIASDIVCVASNGIAINLSPLELYYQGLDNFMALCKRTLAARQVHFHYGSGATIEIARVLARSHFDRVESEPGLALNHLKNCSLQATELPSKEKEQLNRIGIRTLGQLIALPLDEIGKRFNNQIITYLLAIKGVKQPPYSLFHPRKVFSQYLELPYAVESAPRLSRYIAIVLANNCAYLQKRNLATDTLQFELQQREHDNLMFKVNAGTPHHHLSEWQMLIDLKLEQLKLDSPVTSLTLTCDQLVEFDPENLSLLQSSYSRHAENMLLGKLLARLGSDSVKTVEQVNEHRQDYVVQQACALHKAPACSEANGLQPLWLMVQPQPLTEQTQIVYGPERVHTGWWDDHPVKRDYFLALTGKGQRLWVYRDDQQHWYVHGYFG